MKKPSIKSFSLKSIHFNEKERKFVVTSLCVWGVVLIGAGSSVRVNAPLNTEINKKYSISISQKKVAQSRTNEIILKNITQTQNTALSLDVRDYLENPNNVDISTINALKLDTSTININEIGTYTYKIIYKKKTFTGTVVVKEKELPAATFTLKNLEFKVGSALSKNISSYVQETLSEEILNNTTIDLTTVDTTKAGNYQYTITYNKQTYTGSIIISQEGPNVKTNETADGGKVADSTCPGGSSGTYPECVCSDPTTEYNATTNTCDKKIMCPSGSTGIYPNCVCSSDLPIYDSNTNTCNPAKAVQLQ